LLTALGEKLVPLHSQDRPEKTAYTFNPLYVCVCVCPLYVRHSLHWYLKSTDSAIKNKYARAVNTISTTLKGKSAAVVPGSKDFLHHREQGRVNKHAHTVSLPVVLNVSFAAVGQVLVISVTWPELTHRVKRAQLLPAAYFAAHSHTYVGLARTIYLKELRCIYGIYGRDITIHLVIYGADIRFWPTLHICHFPFPSHTGTQQPTLPAPTLKAKLHRQ